MKIARRLLRAAGWEYEALLRQAEGLVAQPVPEPSHMAVETVSRGPSRPTAKQKTFEQVFELFINDPTRKRAKKTVAGYRDGIEIIYSVVGRDRLLADIDRELCRKLLDTLQWLPTNSPKKFPTLTAVQASKMARQKGRKDLLGPVSINGYMIMLSSILNFAINEELIERNPCRGLRVIDPIKKRDKRLPFSNEQLSLIFNSPIYRQNAEWSWNSAKFWVPLINLSHSTLGQSHEAHQTISRNAFPCESFPGTRTQNRSTKPKTQRYQMARNGLGETQSERRSDRGLPSFPGHHLGVDENPPGKSIR